MKTKILLFVLVILAVVPLTIQAQVTKAEFERYQKEVELKITDLKMQVELKNMDLEKSQILYEKALEHIGLTEKVDDKINGWFDYQINILSFLLGFISLVAAVLGYNAFTFNRSLQEKISKLKAQAQVEIEQQTQLIKSDLIRDFEAKFQYERNIILSTFKKEEQIQGLMKNSRILVISSPDDSENQPFYELKNAYPYTELLNTEESFTLPDIDFSNYDIIVIDNQDKKSYHWDFNEDALKNSLIELVDKAGKSNLAFLYYGDSTKDGKIAQHPVWKHRSKTNTFSNNLDTLVNAVNRVLLNRQSS